MPPEVIVIRGAPGVGKSSAAKALASAFPGGARIEVDVLRMMIISVDWKNQEEHIRLLDATAGVVHDLAEFGYRPVIVVDTFSGDKVTRFVAQLLRRNADRRVGVYALHASDEVLRGRLLQRTGDGFKDFEISRGLNEDVLRFRSPGERLIDTSGHSPEQVAREIIGEVVNGGGVRRAG